MEHRERDFTVTSSARTEWLVPAGLLLLSTVPVAAGAFRLTQLTVGADITPENARFFAAPIPIVVHIVGATLYSVLGAFQFVPNLRQRRPGGIAPPGASRSRPASPGRWQ